MRERADAHLNEEAVKTEQVVLVNDLRGDLVGRSDEVRAEGAPLGIELLAARRRPATLAPGLALGLAAGPQAAATSNTTAKTIEV